MQYFKMRIKQGDENMSHELHICWIAVNDLLAMVKKLKNGSVTWLE